jgi:hypothetical protein
MKTDGRLPAFICSRCSRCVQNQSKLNNNDDDDGGQGGDRMNSHQSCTHSRGPGGESAGRCPACRRRAPPPPCARARARGPPPPPAAARNSGGNSNHHRWSVTAVYVSRDWGFDTSVGIEYIISNPSSIVCGFSVCFNSCACNACAVRSQHRRKLSQAMHQPIKMDGDSA